MSMGREQIQHKMCDHIHKTTHATNMTDQPNDLLPPSLARSSRIVRTTRMMVMMIEAMEVANVRVSLCVW